MTLTSLDAIVRNCLLRKKYPLHFYIDFMVYAVSCLRELSADDLKCVNTKRLPVDTNTNAVELPNDFQDYVTVGIRSGQNIKPLVESNKINSIVNRDADFASAPYGNANPNEQSSILYYGNSFPFFWGNVTWNQFGESIGRMFGFGAGIQDDVFKVVRERNQIQLTENLGVTEIVLEYISDGMSSDAATRITPYAYETIAAYITWQLRENSRSYGLGDRQVAKQEYVAQRQILRARTSDLTPEVLKRIIQKASYASAR